MENIGKFSYLDLLRGENFGEWPLPWPEAWALLYTHHDMSRQYPEKLKMLTHNNIKQVSMQLRHCAILFINMFVCFHIIPLTYIYMYNGMFTQVVLCKFHTVFLSRHGEVFTCGHSHVGRLGHKNEQSIIVRYSCACESMLLYLHMTDISFKNIIFFCY